MFVLVVSRSFHPISFKTPAQLFSIPEQVPAGPGVGPEAGVRKKVPPTPLHTQSAASLANTLGGGLQTFSAVRAHELLWGVSLCPSLCSQHCLGFLSVLQQTR